MSLRTLLVMIVPSVLLAAIPAAQDTASRLYDFAGDVVGVPPAGFDLVESREATPRRWGVERDGENHLLAHTPGSHEGRGMALALVAGARLAEPRLSVRLRLRTGDRSAGLVWRYQDKDNYYFAQLRLSDQSLALYRMVNGNRIRIEEEDDLELDPDAWHTLTIRQGRQSARVYLGGIRVFEARDRTFLAPGAVGIWSRDDAGAHFDDLRVGDRE